MENIDIKKALHQQQNEIDDFTIYSSLGKTEKDENNKLIFTKIALEEHGHYEFLKNITKIELKPRVFVVFFYTFLAKIFGTSFALKFMESREEDSKSFYKELIVLYPKASYVYEQEMHHEIELIDMLNDKKLSYSGAIVLGMNDALVELTGTLTGIALAFEKSTIVGTTGLIMGIAASLSMAGSAYLESRESDNENITPSTYSLYTGVSYILTTLSLVIPFFIFDTMLFAVITMLFVALIAILLYNFYISVAKNLDFFKRVKEMSYITFGVALISFIIGYVVKNYFGFEI